MYSPAACASMRAAISVHARMCTAHMHMHMHTHVHVRMGGACPRARPDPGWLYRHSQARNARGSRCICHVAHLRKADVVCHGLVPFPLPAHPPPPGYICACVKPSSITAALDHDNIGVTADGEVDVGRRRSHRADVSRPRQQCRQAGLLAHGWARHGRWCHDRAPSGARCAKAAIAFQLFVS